MIFGEAFRDHHAYSEADLRTLVSTAKKAGAHYLITTEKDWAKVERHLRNESMRTLVVRIKYEIPEEFWYFLRKRLEQNV